MTDKQLPIMQVIPELKHTLQSHSAAVLIAQPGAGKTTVTPLELLHEPWLVGQKIIMLEPRRLAARAAAAQMAKTLGEPTGKTVGYRIRMDTKVGKTRGLRWLRKAYSPGCCNMIRRWRESG